ncbi:MAG: hypothetical protein KGL35_18475 [Bradyrhizobium sp.]|nr:hypothetical protein [Bradyrhizobium sp.]
MQAQKMLRDVAVNHDLQKIKRSMLSDVRSRFSASNKTQQPASSAAKKPGGIR